MTEQKKLKLGLLLDSLVIPAWFHLSIERIVNSGCAQFSLIVLNADGQKLGGAPRKLSLLRRNKKNIAYELLNRIDKKIFFREPDAFRPVPVQDLLPDVPSVSITPFHDRNVDVFRHEDLDMLRTLDLDILIKLGFQNLHSSINSVARYGIWSYDHRDNRLFRGGPPGFWEAVENWPSTGITLSMTNEEFPDGRVIFRSQIMTFKYSPARNRNTLFWHSSSFLPKQIELLYRLGESDFLHQTDQFNTEWNIFHHKQNVVPSNIEAIKCYVGLYLKQFSELYHKFFSRDQWFLLFNATASKTISIHDFQMIIPPKDRFWADPHVIHKEEKIFIFVEEFIYKKGKGHISVIEMDLQGHYKAPVSVLVENYHLSYPFVFEYDQKYFMIPESNENNGIDLYESVDFPSKWEFRTCLLSNIDAKDTTLFYYQGKWWLFTGITDNPGAKPEVELHIFYAEDLFSTKWQPHRLNPVISDVTTARPAGRLFMEDGKVYRPSQDCSKSYGYGININEIQQLTPDEYSEKKVAEIKPFWDNKVIATHTYTNTGKFTIIDAFTRRPLFSRGVIQPLRRNDHREISE